MTSEQTDSYGRFRTGLDRESCLRAIRREARPETMWTDVGMSETTLYRLSPAGFDLRFKRPLVRTILHNAFEVAMEGTPEGTTLTVSETAWVSRAWWVPGLAALIFFGLVVGASTGVRHGILVALGMAALATIGAFIFSAVVMTSLTESDRRRLSRFLETTVDAERVDLPTVRP